MQQVVFSYTNPNVNSMIYTPVATANELLAFAVGEGVTTETLPNKVFVGEYFDYLVSVLDPLDKLNALAIAEELDNRLDGIIDNYIYRSLVETNEVYIRYEYQLGRRFTKIVFYTYGPEPELGAV